MLAEVAPQVDVSEEVPQANVPEEDSGVSDEHALGSWDPALGSGRWPLSEEALVRSNGGFQCGWVHRNRGSRQTFCSAYVHCGVKCEHLIDPLRVLRHRSANSIPIETNRANSC